MENNKTDKYGNIIHKHFDFDAQYTDEILDNKEIIKFVEDDGVFKNKKVIIHSHEGAIWALIVRVYDYNIYNYYDKCLHTELPYDNCIDYSAYGTIEILIDLIKQINY